MAKPMPQACIIAFKILRQFSKLLNVLCCFANWKLELISTDNSFDYVLSVEQGFFFPGITSDICFHRNFIFSQKPSFLKFNTFDILLGSNFTSYAIINNENLRFHFFMILLITAEKIDVNIRNVNISICYDNS